MRFVHCREKTSLDRIGHGHGANGARLCRLGQQRQQAGQVLEALRFLFVQLLQEIVDCFLHLLLVRSGIHVFLIVRIGGTWWDLRWRWVFIVPSSVTKTCHTMLSLFSLGICMDIMEAR